MPKPTLFVCKSCHRASEKRPGKPPFDGNKLDQLNTLCAEKFPAIAVNTIVATHKGKERMSPNSSKYTRCTY